MLMRVWLTTPDRTRRLDSQPDHVWQAGKGAPHLPVLTVDDSKTYQTMDGFGAALTDSSAWLLMKAMSEAARESLLRDLFHPTEGIGFSVLRLPIGASDFTVSGSYTYHDIPVGEQDPDLKRFSIAHDREYILPLLRRIRQINPQLKIIASPWTAPAWMKTNRKLHGGWLDWPAYSSFAKYFVRFIQAYAAEGVPIYAVTPQNEPRLERDSYPTMRMEPRDQARFIGEHLGPALTKARLRTKILIWDHNWDMPQYPLTVLADTKARRYIAGTAFHGYAGDVRAQAKILNAYPNKEIHFTESSGGEWATDFGDNIRWDITHLLVEATRYGARTVLKWNLVLDENHGPQNGGCTNCHGIVTLNRKIGQVIRNEEFYAFGHASKFITPGAKRIASSELPNLPNVAFKNPNGSHALILCNTAMTSTTITLRWRESVANLSIPAGAAMTLFW